MNESFREDGESNINAAWLDEVSTRVEAVEAKENGLDYRDEGDD